MLAFYIQESFGKEEIIYLPAVPNIGTEIFLKRDNGDDDIFMVTKVRFIARMDKDAEEPFIALFGYYNTRKWKE